MSLSTKYTENILRPDEVLLRVRPKNCVEMVRQFELGLPGHVCVGNFLDEFYSAKEHERQSFLDVDIPDSEYLNDIERVSIAAMIEKLAHDYALKVPDWVESNEYFLSYANYGSLKEEYLTDRYKELLISETPTEYSKRNMFVSSNVLSRY
jgi:hypothetical protein